jgi:hypothetical protein
MSRFVVNKFVNGWWENLLCCGICYVPTTRVLCVTYRIVLAERIWRSVWDFLCKDSTEGSVSLHWTRFTKSHAWDFDVSSCWMSAPSYVDTSCLQLWAHHWLFVGIILRNFSVMGRERVRAYAGWLVQKRCGILYRNSWSRGNWSFTRPFPVSKPIHVLHHFVTVVGTTLNTGTQRDGNDSSTWFWKNWQPTEGKDECTDYGINKKETPFNIISARIQMLLTLAMCCFLHPSLAPASPSRYPFTSFRAFLFASVFEQEGDNSFTDFDSCSDPKRTNVLGLRKSFVYVEEVGR